MKVELNEKPFLENGRHKVSITKVESGRSEHKDVPFFNCRFENEEGFVNHRFYLNEPGQPIMAELFHAVGIDDKRADTDQLKGKELSIEVHERTYDDPESGKEKTIKAARHFKAVGHSDTSESI
ncbi:hypothetical protein [Catalinimonas niigatensis]|uniref:hypothetical protein n=1 Tax=Catalinimonas niigatensis TaxID=1397264 RepID=UPI002665AE70|nr:hypothetical protein [Catalinimonas niigatensis]WPP52993.1 hypothetical protein PZB72_11465 [Catalinimonas niigatensis]